MGDFLLTDFVYVLYLWVLYLLYIYIFAMLIDSPQQRIHVGFKNSLKKLRCSIKICNVRGFGAFFFDTCVNLSQLFAYNFKHFVWSFPESSIEKYTF